jgi:lysophospholipase L1-like esterase
LLRFIAVVLGVTGTIIATQIVGAIGLHYDPKQSKPRIPKEIRSQVVKRNYGISVAPDPYLVFRATPDRHHEYVETNAHGFRNPPISQTPAPGTFRVLMLGGSVAYGHTSTSNRDTIAAMLQVYLNERAHRHEALRGLTVEVLNAAVPAYVAWQEALAYSIYHRELEPHVVIMLNGANDVAAVLKSNHPGWPLQFDGSAMPFLPREPTLLGELGTWLHYRFQKMKLVRWVRGFRMKPIERENVPAPGEVAAAYRDALVLISDIARIDGALAMPVLQPLAILPGTKPLTEFERELVAYDDAMRPGVNAYYDDVYRAFRGVLSELGRQRPDLLAVDASHAYADVEEIAYTDHCHLTPTGRRVLAEAIGEALLARLDASEAPGSRGG